MDVSKTDEYADIREENITKYGTDVSNYGKTLLADLYSDKTHFIYELIQNAEDACERAKDATNDTTTEYYIHFNLFPDRLEVEHNGIPFDQEDIRSICAIGHSTKSSNSDQIGKFGIGFKSVYAFTTSPIVYSGEKSFKIENFVHPWGVAPKNPPINNKTLIEVPFNHHEVLASEAFTQIKECLRKLNPRTILFLRRISRITWTSSNGEKGGFSKKVKREQFHSEVSLLRNSVNETEDNWILFEKPVKHSNGHNLSRVEIAYQLGVDKNNKNKQVVPARDTRLFAYFQTEKETHLKFLVNAPFSTTPPRDNIKDNLTNKELLKETASLVSESISSIKNLGLLNISFLNTLPIESEDFTDGGAGNLLVGVFLAVKEKLKSSEGYLPSNEETFITPENALIPGNSALRELLGKNQLQQLFSLPSPQWLNDAITENKTPKLMQYLVKELKVGIISSERFAQAFSETFIEKQTDEWVINFYLFLSEQKSLWDYTSGTERFRTKPIIRLETGDHVRLYSDNYGLLQEDIFLPSDEFEYFRCVKKSIAENPEAKKFLEDFGLKVPSLRDHIFKQIIPLYRNEGNNVTQEENIKHVDLIIKQLKLKKEFSDKDIKKLKETPLLYAKNLENQKSWYVEPNGVYFGHQYTNNNDVETFYDGNSTWVIDERYQKLDWGYLDQIGVSDHIKIKKRQKDNFGYVTIMSYHGRHKRGINGFDPDFDVDNLEFVLKTINPFRAKIIWNIAKEHHQCLRGKVQVSSNQYYSIKEEEEMDSKFTELLRLYPWVPDKEWHFHKMDEITFSEINDQLEKDSIEAKYLAKFLFREDELYEALQALPVDMREEAKQFFSMDPEKRKRLLQETGNMNEVKDDSGVVENELGEAISEEETKNEIEKEFSNDELLNHENAKIRSISKENEFRSKGNQTTNEVKPEEVENENTEIDEGIISEYKNEIQNEVTKSYRRVKNLNIDATYGQMDSELRDNLRRSLVTIHDGWCQDQNCSFNLLTINPNTGSVEPLFFATYYLPSNKRKIDPSTELGNVISLCPNHHYEFRMTVRRPLKDDRIKIEKISEQAYRIQLTKFRTSETFSLIYSLEHLNKLKLYFNTVNWEM